MTRPFLKRGPLWIPDAAICRMNPAFVGSTHDRPPTGGGGGGGGGYSLIFSTGKAGDADGVTTDSVNATGADLIVIVQSCFHDIPLPTDSQGNVYTQDVLRQYPSDTSYQLRILHCKSPSVSASMTFAAAEIGTYDVLTVFGFSGSGASPFDQAISNSGGGIITLQAGALTPSQNGCLIIAGYNCDNSTDSLAIDSGFSTPIANVPSAGAEKGAGSYLIQGTAASVNPTWTRGLSGDMLAALAIYK